MKNTRRYLVIASLICLALALLLSCGKPLLRHGAEATSHYPNLFTDLLGVGESLVTERLESAFQQLFYGDDRTQRIYYPAGPDMAYIEDILHNDVRTEGISYGMMIAVQLDKKAEFDRLWKWAKTYMQHQEGPSKGFFAWHCTPAGEKLSVSAAPDGEEWIVTALFFASHRWGDDPGIYNYRAEAQAILDAMLSKEPASDLQAVITNMFNREHRQVVFVPNGEADGFTDPSYHLPHYYELWARWADKEKAFWQDAAAVSREFLKKAAHPVTGLTPDYANFDGTATDAPWGGGHDAFRFDAWRTAMNVAVDWVWFACDEWAIQQSNRLLEFFNDEGLARYVNQYALDGQPLSEERSPGLVAMNGTAALAATTPLRTGFVRAVWEQPVPDGPGRYYDGLLHMLALLQLGGQFRIYAP